MTIVAIDIQPQCRFACQAANDMPAISNPEQIVPELNRQAKLADKRILVENRSKFPGTTLCDTLLENHRLSHPCHNSKSSFFQRIYECRGQNLFPGIPCSADYDQVIETHTSVIRSACFYDALKHHNTDLFLYLMRSRAHTVIIGGLATEFAVRNTALDLAKSDRWQVIVNLSACRGYSPDAVIETVATLRRHGVKVVTDTSELEQFVGQNQTMQYCAQAS